MLRQERVTLIFYLESKRSICVENFVSNNFGLLLGHFRVDLYG
jgi:hypothetical protein